MFSSFCYPSFFERARGVWRGADNRRIDKNGACLGRGVRLQTRPELAPEPTLFPAAKAIIDRVPVSKRLWQVTPGHPSASQGKHGCDEHPIAEPRRTPGTGLDSSEDGSNRRPCLLSQQQTYRHQVASSMHKMNGIEKTYPGIMNSSTRPSIVPTHVGVNRRRARPWWCHRALSPRMWG